jgi:hypothetical protein
MSASRSSAWWRWRTPAAPIPSRRLRRLSALLAVSSLAAACSLWPGREVPAPFAPLAPSTYGGSVRAEQILTLASGGSTSTLQAYVDVTPQQIKLVGLTALAQRVLSVTSDASGLSGTAPPPLRIENLLADLQLATWPLAALQQAMAGGDFSISEAGRGMRRVLYRGEPYAEVHYAGPAPPWDGRIWLVNFPYRYTLDIDSHPLQ